MCLVVECSLGRFWFLESLIWGFAVLGKRVGGGLPFLSSWLALGLWVLPGRFLFFLISHDLSVSAGWASPFCPSQGGPACALGFLSFLAGFGPSGFPIALAFYFFPFFGERPFSLSDPL